MSFIGIVTRKEQDTGVTLEAKIVTPNKKKAAKQKFKVRIKKTGLTDYECCVLDQSTIRNKLYMQQDLTAVKTDINFTYNGENGTSIEYSIENTGEPLLTNYIGEDGKLIGRPRYGENDSSGYIVMTVKKGIESIPTQIRVTVKQTMAQEVLACSAIKESSLWNAIRGNNAPWSNTEATSGHRNIFYNLDLITTTDSKKLSSADRNTLYALTTEPIQIAWSVQDTATNDVITQQRINSSTGEIFTPSYKAACTLIGTSVDAVLIGANQYSKRVRIGGLTLKATLTLGTETKELTFGCSTCSKYITNEEVGNFKTVQSNADIVIGTTLSRLGYKEISDSSVETLVIPASAAGTLYYLGLASATTATQSYKIDELELGIGSVDYSFQHRICEFKTTDIYDDTDGIFSAVTITNTAREDNEHFGSSTRFPLTVDVNRLKNANADRKSFTIETTVTTTRYTKDGTSESAGGGIETKLYCHIKLDDSAVPVPSV